MDHVKLGGEALAIHQVLRGRVKVRRLQFKGTTPKHGSVAGSVVHVDLSAVVMEGCLGTPVREEGGAGAASLVVCDVDGGLLLAVGAGAKSGEREAQRSGAPGPV